MSELCKGSQSGKPLENFGAKARRGEFGDATPSLRLPAPRQRRKADRTAKESKCGNARSGLAKGLHSWPMMVLVGHPQPTGGRVDLRPYRNPNSLRHRWAC